MAGGDVNVLRNHWPQGADSVVPWTIPLAVGTVGAASKNVFIGKIPFKLRCVAAEFYAESVTDTDDDGTLTVQDDTGTPKKIINAADLGGTSATPVRRTLVVDPNVTFFAESIMTAIWTGGDVGDAATGVVLTLWVQPVVNQ